MSGISSNFSTAFRHNKLPGWLLLLGALEFFVAALLLLVDTSDAKTAILWGYSLPRLMLFTFAVALGAALLIEGVLSLHNRSRWMGLVMTQIEQNPSYWSIGLYLILSITALLLLAPRSFGSGWIGYIDTLRPILFAALLFGLQFFVWLRAKEIKTGPSSEWQLQSGLIGFLIIGALIGIIFLTGWGLVPDGEKWNSPGIPVTSFQTLATLSVSALIGLMIASRAKKITPWVDLALVIILWGVGWWVWDQTPMRGNYFGAAARPPYMQSFPESDAQVHDTGAISILNGWGIKAGGYTDKPLYIAFLAGLHTIAKYNYTLLISLQTAVLALMLPLLYILGLLIHSRAVGLSLSGLMLLKQTNAITLANTLVFHVNPRLLMTETLLTLGFVAMSVIVFLSMTRYDFTRWLPFFAGGLLGVLSLIRQNPLFLFPFLPTLLLLHLWKDKKSWLLQSMQFLLGFFIIIAPWILTGQDNYGRPYLFIKFLDVIESRYNLRQAPQPTNPTVEIPAKPSWTPSGETATLPSETGDDKPVPQPVDATEAPPSILTRILDGKKFPGFILNHTLYNLVSGFLTLPDSWQSYDQEPSNIANRPAWSAGDLYVSPQQIPFLIFNLLILALGLSFAWRRWRWAGLSFFVIYLAYSLSLAMARTSGSRYIQPVDWIFLVYYLLGLAELLRFLPSQLRERLQAEPPTSPLLPTSNPLGKRIFNTVLAAILFISFISIPVADNLIPLQNSLCENEIDDSVFENLAVTQPGSELVFAKSLLLYPQIEPEGQQVTLFMCKEEIHTVFLRGFHQKIIPGETVIIGWPAEKAPSSAVLLISNDNQQPELLWQNLP